jgi:hypothetical protein
MTTASLVAIGIHTKTSSAITDRWHEAWRAVRLRSFRISSSAACSRTRLCYGRPSSVECRARKAAKGRDHNPYVFTNWLCGGGIKGGIVHGESDQWGYKPLDRKNPTYVWDIHATMLRLLGIEHTKLTWRHNGNRSAADRCARECSRGDYCVGGL